MRDIWLNKFGRTRAPRTRGCPNAAPATMPLPAEAREGSSGLVGDTPTPAHVSLMASTTTDGNLAVYDDAALLREQTLKVSATSPEIMDTGSRSTDALSDMH